MRHNVGLTCSCITVNMNIYFDSVPHTSSWHSINPQLEFVINALCLIFESYQLKTVTPSCFRKSLSLFKKIKQYILILKICISSSSVEKRDDTEYFQSHFFLSFYRSDSSGLTRFLCCATLSLIASFLSFQPPHFLKVSDRSVSLDPLSLSLYTMI